MYKVSYQELEMLARMCAQKLDAMATARGLEVLKIFPVPRGGVPAALAVQQFLKCRNILVPSSMQANVIVDDLIDSGATEARFSHPFHALIDKRQEVVYKDQWIVWPWEKDSEGSIEDNVRRILQFVGEDPARGGLEETPARVAKAWQFWCKGYGQDPKDILKTFEDGAEGCDEMVVIANIPFYSHCEHHMAPFFGHVTAAYIPDGKIVGLSKVNRLVDAFARRLQVQERFTGQIADALMENLNPLGVGVVVKGRHMCVESRGVQHSHCATVTSALRGVFKDEPSVRSEFLELGRTTREP